MAKDKTGSITTHIDSSHEKGDTYGKHGNHGNPKTKEGHYANAEGKNSSDCSM